MAKRMVVKVGSSSLTDESGKISIKKIQNIVEQVARLQVSGDWQMTIVSSGAVAAGISRLGQKRATATMPEKQAAAAIGQGLLMQAYERHFTKYGIAIGQLLFTRDDMEYRKRFVNIRNTIEALLRHQVIPIINENDSVAVDEIRFGDNDRLAGLVAIVEEADRLVMLTDIDGLYNANPRLHVDAQRMIDVWEITPEIEHVAGGVGSMVGTGGMYTKIQAAKMAVQTGIDVTIAASDEKDVLIRIAEGEKLGTTFHAQERLSARKSWLLHSSRTEGYVVVDKGAAQALSSQSASLLLPGITDVHGEFHEGDTIEIQISNGQTIGRGMTNFSASDLHALLERRMAGERLGPMTEVIHRNDMVCKGGTLV